jgi:hypothetical protein
LVISRGLCRLPTLSGLGASTSAESSHLKVDLVLASAQVGAINANSVKRQYIRSGKYSRAAVSARSSSAAAALLSRPNEDDVIKSDNYDENMLVAPAAVSLDETAETGEPHVEQSSFVGGKVVHVSALVIEEAANKQSLGEQFHSAVLPVTSLQPKQGDETAFKVSDITLKRDLDNSQRVGDGVSAGVDSSNIGEEIEIDTNCGSESDAEGGDLGDDADDRDDSIGEGVSEGVASDRESDDRGSKEETCSSGNNEEDDNNMTDSVVSNCDGSVDYEETVNVEDIPGDVRADVEPLEGGDNDSGSDSDSGSGGSSSIDGEDCVGVLGGDINNNDDDDANNNVGSDDSSSDVDDVDSNSDSGSNLCDNDSMHSSDSNNSQRIQSSIAQPIESVSPPISSQLSAHGELTMFAKKRKAESAVAGFTRDSKKRSAALRTTSGRARNPAYDACITKRGKSVYLWAPLDMSTSSARGERRFLGVFSSILHAYDALDSLYRETAATQTGTMDVAAIANDQAASSSTAGSSDVLKKELRYVCIRIQIDDMNPHHFGLSDVCLSCFSLVFVRMVLLF